ncbi:MAG: hypothetical protein ACK2UO_04095 [Caldilineaceae bacterium]
MGRDPRRIEAVTERQQARIAKLDDARTSSRCSNLTRVAVEQINVIARACDRVLKLGRTIADLAGDDDIQSQHLADSYQQTHQP